MSLFYFDLDIKGIEDFLGLESAAQSEAERAARELAVATHAKMVELAQERLHSRRGMYLKGLSYFEAEPGVFVVNLDASVRWIDDGLPEHEMLDDLLKSKKAKRAKDGSTYISVPFQLNKRKQDQTQAQQSLMKTVADALKSAGTTPNQVETYASGRPKTGLVRSVDINAKPISRRSLRIGGGPFGRVAQGTTGGIPLLRGVRVYQRENAAGKVERHILTFRTASSKQRGSGKWRHPGTKPMQLMEAATSWALQQWASKIAPALMERIQSRIR